jgi:mono/diheme cytochrome c family protein
LRFAPASTVVGENTKRLALFWLATGQNLRSTIYYLLATGHKFLGGHMPRLTAGLLLLALGTCCCAADVDDKEVKLLPGLVTTYRDTARPAPREIIRLEPTIALALKSGEAPHPALAGDGGTARWAGQINILRAGAYRFSVMLRGKFRLSINGKAVLTAEVNDAGAALKVGPEVHLEEGVHPILAEFTRPAGVARVELFWQAAHLHNEPMPFDLLGHLPDQEPARLRTLNRVERGRLLAEEHNCIRCHQPADGDRMAHGLQSRQAPDLSQLGQRVYPGWIYRWLESPRKMNPSAAMPKMFSDDEAGCVDRFAVTRYLVSLGGPIPASPKPPRPNELKASVARGERLFTSVGCIACHGDPFGVARPESAKGVPGRATMRLPSLGSKTNPEKLALYLVDSLTVDPSGRMPRMGLNGNEAHDLARFLCQAKEKDASEVLPPAPAKEALLAAFKRVDARADELAAFQRLDADAQWIDLGKRLVIDKGCNNCHTIAPGGKNFANMLASASFDDLKTPARQRKGCLADATDKRGKAPSFAFAATDREDLRHFLKEGLKGAGSPAPAHMAKTTLARFNCLACHSRDGEGGITSELTEQLRRYERAENAEAVSPPPLTGVAHKLRTPWLRQVLIQGGRARPWMGLRMPQFGEANVGKLPELLAALEGTEPSDKVDKIPLTTARLDAGRFLVGKSSFGCISCHDLAGIPNSGTRGPDLAQMDQRVRYDWYRRWLQQPQSMQPGTRMPAIFDEGKSLQVKVLGGHPDAQAEAIWAYLSLGPNLPLPEGMEPPKGLIVAVKDRPVLLRTFMPDAGSRAVAVGYPGGVSLAFDAARCRLAYSWSGNFLDASPVWNDRGGNPARVLGQRFWIAPQGCPVAVNTSQDLPDFGALAKDPAYGGPLPEGQLFKGRSQLKFSGYRLDKEGLPTFRYTVNAAESQQVDVRERPEPLRSKAGPGVARQFTLRLAAGQTAWLLAGETGAEPRLLNAKAARVPLDLKSGAADVPAANRLLLLQQLGEKVVVLALAGLPDGARWRLQRQNGTWRAILQLPAAKEAGEVRFALKVWAPYRPDEEFLKELADHK